MPLFTTVFRRSPTIRVALPLLGFLCLTGGLCGNAFASPVTYTLTGLFTGSLGGQSFSDTQGTFTLSGSDTSSTDTTNPAFFFNTLGSAMFQLGTNAAVDIQSSTFGVESEYGAASFLDQASGFAAGEYNELTAYDVLGQYGSTTGSFVSYGQQAQQTSGGALVLTGASGDVTFTAAAPTAVTPEPQTLLLTATGLLGVGGALRRRFQQKSMATA